MYTFILSMHKVSSHLKHEFKEVTVLFLFFLVMRDEDFICETILFGECDCLLQML